MRGADRSLDGGVGDVKHSLSESARRWCIRSAVSGRTEVSATLAFRVARLLDASISQVLTGTALPPGTCKHCGNTNQG